MSTRLKLQKGFTLIEMIVSLGIFAMVITMAVGALLVLISSNQRLQDEQGVMTNLSFAVDSITRELRTGYGYYCAGVDDSDDEFDGERLFDDGREGHDELSESSVNDCDPASGIHDKLYRGVSFVEGGDSISQGANRIMFYFHENVDDPSLSTIMRRVGDNSAQSIVSSGLTINNAKFVVTGSIPQSSGDNEQPTVTIYVEAEEKNDSTKKYRIQTTVTQRILDL